MAGANYMGGKRNAARARTKDAAGRAQKRHFGRQRLAAALCMTREDRRIHLSKPTLSSVLPEIDLAHARRDIVDDVPSPVNQAFESVRLHSPPSPNDDKRRRNPSKILVALDTSDHISMRTAIDRILRRPDLVGLRGQGLKQTTNNERIHGPMVVRGSTDFYPDSQCTEPNNAIGQSKFRSSPLHDDCTTFSPNTNCEHPIDPEAVEKGVLSTPHSPLSNCEAALWNTFDDSGYAEPQPSIHAYPHTPQSYESRLPDHSFQEHNFSLPQSSPCVSDSSTSDHMILDFDTSPLAPSLRFRYFDAKTQSYRFQEETHTGGEYHDATELMSTHSVDTSPSHRSARIPGAHQYDRSYILSPSPDAEALEAEFHAICYVEPTRDIAFSWKDEDELKSSSPSELRRDSVQVSTSMGVPELVATQGLPLDLLSDPDPWATIGKILNLEPQRHAEGSVEIEFTKGREGVGYISTGKSNIFDCGSLDVMGPSSSTPDVKLIGDFRVASRACTPGVPVIEDQAIPSADEGTTADIPIIPLANTVVRPPLAQSPFPFPDTESFQNHPPETKRSVHVDAPEKASSIEPTLDIAATKYAHAKPARSIAWATVDADNVYQGPCLFGDSDFEEDE